MESRVVAPVVPSSPGVASTATPWPVRLFPILVVIGLQVGLMLNANHKAGWGMDFHLLYTVAATWGEGRDPYDDAELKRTWAAYGGELPAPGRPQTPNVYPLSIAPVAWPLTRLSITTATNVWLLLTLLCFAWLLRAVLAHAFQSGDPSPAQWRVAALVLVILLAGYPARMNLASLNVAMICGVLSLAALRDGMGAIRAGLLMGLGLLKYSVTGPLMFLLIWRRRFRAAAVAIVIQLALMGLATWGAGSRSPLDWITGMKRELDHSMASRQINAPDAWRDSAMFLDLRRLWFRIAGYDSLAYVPYIALLAVPVLICIRLDRRFEGRRGALADPVAATLLAFALCAFYHRAYDLVPLIALIGACLLTYPSASLRRPLSRGAIWLCLAATVLPGLWMNWSLPTLNPWMDLLVQPACAWATLWLCPLLALFTIRAASIADIGRIRRSPVAELPPPSHGRAHEASSPQLAVGDLSCHPR